MKTKNKKTNFSKEKVIPKIFIFKSLKYFSAQAVDMETGKVLFGISDKKMVEKTKSKRIQEMAKKFAQNLKKRKITRVRLERGNYKYHGNIKIFIDVLAKEGVKI